MIETIIKKPAFQGKNREILTFFTCGGSWLLYRDNSSVGLHAGGMRRVSGAINTIQAVRRSVVLAMHAYYEHLGEMRQAMLGNDNNVSHISDMPDQPRLSVTTLRSACMVLIALRA